MSKYEKCIKFIFYRSFVQNFIKIGPAVLAVALTQTDRRTDARTCAHTHAHTDAHTYAHPWFDCKIFSKNH